MKSFPDTHQKIWRVKTPAPELCHIFARKLGISPITAQLLINRGIYTVEHGRAFLGSELERLHSPLLLKDMTKAVERILTAVRGGQNILVYGDYDVDGVTATALLVKVFRCLGAPVSHYIPNRLEEGYGLHLEALQKVREKGADLVVTVDCGINALEEARWAGENGLDIIITDHHEPPAEIPPAFAVINPKRTDCNYPFKELAGVGVALKLAQALLEAAGAGSEIWQNLLDLVCLGTIADIVPIQGENRILVKHGLPELANTGNVGLQALMAVSGVKKEDLGPREVGFGLAPRLNAAGRIGSPDVAVKLLLTDNVGEAWELASELNRGNQTRQKIESAVLEEALTLLERGAPPGCEQARVLVLASENWHPGVVGIVASRLADRFYCPVLLIALEGSMGKGSARSIPGFHIYKALENCREHLLEYGGHAQAAGFSIEGCKIEDFRREINLYAEQVIGDNEMIPQLDLDGIIDVGQVSEELVNEITLLSPFGHRNPHPLLGCREASILESRGVGRGAAHLKLRLRGENGTLDGIGFKLGAYAEVVATAEAVDLAFVPGINEYNGRRTVQLEVKDLGLPAMLDFKGGENQEGFGLASFAGKPAADKEELFIPEFILQTLENFHTPEQPDHYGGSELSHHVEVIDYRDLVERPDQLAQVAGTGESTLVITTCGYQTIELAHFLQLAVPSLKGKVAFCHAHGLDDTGSDPAVLFETGEIKTVVATPAMAGTMGSRARHVLLYHLPYSPETLHCAISALRPEGRLYLLFGARELEDNRAGLEALAPDREYLACLYKALRREGNGKAQMNVSPARVSRMLAAAGFPHSREYTVRVALAILEELGLLTGSGQGESLQIRLLPAPAEKKDLSKAHTYRYLNLIKEESITWMRKMLSDPIENLL